MLYSRSLLVIYFIDSSIYIYVNLNLLIYPSPCPPSPFGNPKFVSCVWGCLSVLEISSFVVVYSLPQSFFFFKLLVQLTTLDICSFLETTNISVYNKNALCEITKSLRILRCMLMDQNVVKLMLFAALLMPF